jgi:hypothetical protein
MSKTFELTYCGLSENFFQDRLWVWLHCRWIDIWRCWTCASAGTRMP